LKREEKRKNKKEYKIAIVPGLKKKGGQIQASFKLLLFPR
jgi:hypothetical protein